MHDVIPHDGDLQPGQGSQERRLGGSRGEALPEEAEEGEELIGLEPGNVGGEDEVEELVDLEAPADVGGELALEGLEGGGEAPEDQELPHQLLRVLHVLHRKGPAGKTRFRRGGRMPGEGAVLTASGIGSLLGKGRRRWSDFAEAGAVLLSQYDWREEEEDDEDACPVDDRSFAVDRAGGR